MFKENIKIIFLFSLFLSSCVSVTVNRVNSEKSIIYKRNDILTNGKLSDYTKTTMQLIGENSKKCENDPLYCIEKLNQHISKGGISKDKLFSALSELWMKNAFLISLDYNSKKNNMQVPSLIESVRYAYAYLFLSDRNIRDRSLENRQNQVRDYYNYGTQRLSMIFYKMLDTDIIDVDSYIIKFGKFNISFDFSKMIKNNNHNNFQRHYDIIPSSSVTFKGIKNIYFRDGIGSEFIISPNNKELIDNIKVDNYQDSVINSITTVIYFPYSNQQNINSTKDLTIRFYDAYNISNITLNNVNIRLAANFTASYGWWLSKSKFSLEAYLTFLKKFTNQFIDPKIYMMQPYNPNKKIIILLHGLFSSPEAWINLANDIMGTNNLRNNYQIWQIYYPTNLPILVNTFNIKNSINNLLKEVDPKRKDKATNNIVLIGHSMGGVISRLLVSDYNIDYFNNFLNEYDISNNQKKSIIKKISPYILLKPLFGIKRVIFLATPHRGAKINDSSIVRFVSRKLISIPNNVYNLIQNSVLSQALGQGVLFSSINSIDSLNNKDPLMGVFYKNISIAKNIKYNSIIANNTPKKSIEDSNDGYVAWKSSHLDGAQSELIIHYNHSVQNSSEAITDIRRILELNINE